MTKRFWIKLYMEILDDATFGTLPEFIKWRAIELFLVAGENGNDGLLPPVARLAWRLRLEEVKIAETLSALTEVGVVHETPQGWVVTHFKERQYSESYERMKRYRERNKERNSDAACDDGVTDDESISISNSSSVSDSEEGGVGGETPAHALQAQPPPACTSPAPNAPVPAVSHRRPQDRCADAAGVRGTNAAALVQAGGCTALDCLPGQAGTAGNAAEEEFNAHFGSFFSERERQRWQALYEAIGFARLSEIATWAERREIAMINRGGLLDSLETAARNWIGTTPKTKGDNREFFKNLAIAAEVKG
jgi:hypothetical protein